MQSLISRWIAQRRLIRQRWNTDASRLIESDERNAYYEAQREAARQRARGNRAEFIHWAKVAAEVARRSPIAEMELSKVQAIVDEELAKRRDGGGTSGFGRP